MIKLKLLQLIKYSQHKDNIDTVKVQKICTHIFGSLTVSISLLLAVSINSLGDEPKGQKVRVFLNIIIKLYCFLICIVVRRLFFKLYLAASTSYSRFCRRKS